MKEVTFLDTLISKVGSLQIICLWYFPSMRTRISSALITLKTMVEFAGKTSEWNTVNEQIGVITKAPSAGSKTGPPAEKE
jgi:hypothetical protein